MSELIKKILGLEAGGELAPLASTAVHSGLPPVDSMALGLHDAVLSGWYLNDSNEVFKGVGISAEDVVVDVGCGDGGALNFCAARGAHLIGVDIDPAVIAHVQKRLEGSAARKMEFMLIESPTLPVADATASRVICTEVLEHVDDPAQVMAELARIGKPGARYLLSVPDALQENLQKQVAPDSYFQKPNHVRIISREDFESLVRDAGLVVEQHDYYGFFWSIWWAMFWTAKVDLSNPVHPLLDQWSRTWQALLETEGGMDLKHKLDAFMPKSQVIVASKPMTPAA
ncbi:class I SAM-dependent methyltransferase [Pseudoxanthomonas gei]|uniref:Class I SAM-dependent methyltransferase n=1 Tax=Pseudoxanthomonas gei TaxID=1383030 RepID=A0ABX0AEV0_9GAMM|nr:class I SAM-dependent methyltransferase [Pseudoxanthomonas gei]NDK40144.1 class I SAM-dependent methyltransferase [Pseudoxanthomonas gei]